MISVPPPTRIPFGTVDVGGKTIELFFAIEWARYFESLNTEVVTKSAGIPGPAGAAGKDGLPGMPIFLAGEVAEENTYIVMPPAASSVATKQTASRSLNTAFQNTTGRPLMIQATARCNITLGAGTAFMQGKSDATATPAVIASGIVGIQAGLIGEDNTFQISFVVAPAAFYQISSTAVNGGVVLGEWFEIIL